MMGLSSFMDSFMAWFNVSAWGKRGPAAAAALAAPPVVTADDVWVDIRVYNLRED
jgi:hypothetical protein